MKPLHVKFTQMGLGTELPRAISVEEIDQLSKVWFTHLFKSNSIE